MYSAEIYLLQGWAGNIELFIQNPKTHQLFFLFIYIFTEQVYIYFTNQKSGSINCQFHMVAC